jgi:hypothetical protein
VPPHSGQASALRFRATGLGISLLLFFPLFLTVFAQPSAFASEGFSPPACQFRVAADRAGVPSVVAIAETLQKLGFNIQLLGSEKYVYGMLQSLSDKEIQIVKEAFAENCHARFMKYFFCHMPFGKKQAYAEEVTKASLERLAHLIKVCGFLMQTKIYLFWISNTPK